MARMVVFALGFVFFVSLGLSDLLAQRGPAPQTSFAGDGWSARLAMNGYPDLAHSFEAAEGR